MVYSYKHFLSACRHSHPSHKVSVPWGSHAPPCRWFSLQVWVWTPGRCGSDKASSHWAAHQWMSHQMSPPFRLSATSPWFALDKSRTRCRWASADVGCTPPSLTSTKRRAPLENMDKAKRLSRLYSIQGCVFHPEKYINLISLVCKLPGVSSFCASGAFLLQRFVFHISCLRNLELLFRITATSSAFSVYPVTFPAVLLYCPSSILLK